MYTLGVRAQPEHVLVDPAAVGAELVRTDRGGDVTYHGPGQLVGYPILSVPMGRQAIPCHVHRVEQLVIDVLADLGLAGRRAARRLPGRLGGPERGPDPRKICAIGVRMSRGRSMHGFALNVDADLACFDHIVPVRHRRQGGDVPRRRGPRGAHGRGRRRHRRGAGRRRAGADRRRVDRQDVAWRVQPEDLARPSRRGERAGGGPGRRCACLGPAARPAGRGGGRSRRRRGHRASASPSGCG